ncbi:hypothetical protein EZV62_010870 [Acer yangbiense]|uniref:Uncharacterized protein n=1 Tax=Acer yangbiense TaxID=1000413 RepID=A0A5C7I5Q1_9ROSI|nr:hypothetical protein EZV62_010870 [Acer yangbiense]
MPAMRLVSLLLCNLCKTDSCCHLRGDCHYKRELLRGYMKIRGHEQLIRTYELLQKLIMWLFHCSYSPCFRGSETVMVRQLRDALLMDKRRMERETHRANTSFNFFHMKSARIEDQVMLNLKILKTKHVAGILAKKILTMRDAT